MKRTTGGNRYGNKLRTSGKIVFVGNTLANQGTGAITPSTSTHRDNLFATQETSGRVFRVASQPSSLGITFKAGDRLFSTATINAANLGWDCLADGQVGVGAGILVPIGMPSAVSFTSIDGAAVTNTAAETTLLGTGSSLIPINVPAEGFPGVTFRVTANGFYTTDADPPTLRIRAKMTVSGGTAVTLYDSNNSGGTTLPVSQTNRPWFFEGVYTYRDLPSNPALSKVIGEGVFSFYDATAKTLVHWAAGSTDTFGSSVQTDLPRGWNLTADWSAVDAGSSITCATLTVETLR